MCSGPAGLHRTAKAPLRGWLPFLLALCVNGENVQSENERLVRAYTAQVISTGNIALLPEFVSPDYIDHNDPEGGITGLEKLALHIRAVRTTYPDFVVEIHECITNGDLVVSRITGIGTHSNEWLGIKPTNKVARISAINIDRVQNGLIVEHWGCANTLEALLEIGALNVPIYT